MMVAWSHLSMAAYEHFLLCEECGAMVHDSHASQAKHNVWHAKIEEQVLYPEQIIHAATRIVRVPLDDPETPQATETGSAGGVTIIKEPPA